MSRDYPEKWIAPSIPGTLLLRRVGPVEYDTAGSGHSLGKLDFEREDKESALNTPSFYTDRTYGAVPRTLEVLPDPTAEGLKSLVQRRIDGNWLAEEFPSYCSDGDGIAGTN